MLNRRTLLATLVAIAFTAAFGPAPAWAQETGTINGVVTDESGAPQSGVKVFLTAPAIIQGGQVRPDVAPRFTTGLGDVAALQARGVRKIAETVTDASGRFNFANIKTGGYVVVVGRLNSPARFPVQVEAGKTATVTAAVKAAQIK